MQHGRQLGEGVVGVRVPEIRHTSNLPKALVGMLPTMVPSLS